ncbi:MAG: hypothetical protein G01um101431_782 [Parcubacteria group bacterium Gr01-1014_31]|nr:MAG: hypothetical protein G01um101431_782 [Parcubacteria group bacterium Gr01-1014_31]
MNQISYYLNFDYLLNLRPEPLGPAGRLLLPIAVAACLAAAIILQRRAAKTADPLLRAGLKRLGIPLLTMGIIGALFTLVAWLGVPILSLRLVLLVWVLVTAWWLIAIARKEWGSLPQRRAAREQRLLKERYLPK